MDEDDVAFLDASVGEKRGDGINGSPEIGEGEVAASGGVHEGDLAMVSLRQDECGDVQGVVWWVCSGLVFAVKDGVGTCRNRSLGQSPGCHCLVPLGYDAGF